MPRTSRLLTHEVAFEPAEDALRRAAHRQRAGTDIGKIAGVASLARPPSQAVLLALPFGGDNTPPPENVNRSRAVRCSGDPRKNNGVFAAEAGYGRSSDATAFREPEPLARTTSPGVPKEEQTGALGEEVRWRSAPERLGG